jgi:hypothetical protein
MLALLATIWWLGDASGLPARARARVAGGAMVRAAIAFLVGTPFALLTPGTFLSDFARQNRIVADGWLGFESVGPGWRYNLHPLLWDGVGGAVAVVSCLAVLWALASGDALRRILAGFCVAYFVYVSLWSAHFDRYLLPILAPLLALCGSLVADLCRRVRRPHVRPVAATLAAVALVVPAVVGSINLLRTLRRPDHRSTAAREFERLVPRGATVATDPLGLPILSELEGRALNRAGHDRAWFRTLRFETPQPGRTPDSLRSVDELRRRGVRWVITSRDIERRIAAAPEGYTLERRFYLEIGTNRTPVLDVPDGLAPGVRLWDLGHARTNRLDARP